MALQHSYRHFSKILTAIAVLTTVSGTNAGDLQDVKVLLREGKLTEALVKADKALESQRADPSMRFTKGLILSEQKKTREAIEVFSNLTIDFPDYPEPYNNLAVLFATEGQYVKARVALETALKIKPEYATAHENMGDVFLQLANQSYVSAAKHDNGNQVLIAKLRAVRQTLGLPANEISVSSIQSLGSAQLKNEQNVSATQKVVGSVQVIPQEREIILKTVEQWARAWGTKDTKAYFSLYSNDFKTPLGETVSQWKSQRRARINGKDQIDIQILSPSVTINGNLATVNFQQLYVAGKLSSNDRKILTLKNYNGTWKILQEKVDP